MPDRPVERRLKEAPTIQPAASPVDRFQAIQPARVVPSLIDFAGFSKTLSKALLSLEATNAEEQNELGAAEFERRLAQAQEGSDNLADAFAKALGRGEIEESNNPYFVTGFRKAAARQLATRWFGEASEAIANGFAASTQVDPKTGVAPIADPAVTPQVEWVFVDDPANDPNCGKPGKPP